MINGGGVQIHSFCQSTMLKTPEDGTVSPQICSLPLLRSLFIDVGEPR